MLTYLFVCLLFVHFPYFRDPVNRPREQRPCPRAADRGVSGGAARAPHGLPGARRVPAPQGARARGGAGRGRGAGRRRHAAKAARVRAGPRAASCEGRHPTPQRETGRARCPVSEGRAPAPAAEAGGPRAHTAHASRVTGVRVAPRIQEARALLPRAGRAGARPGADGGRVQPSRQRGGRPWGVRVRRGARSPEPPSSPQPPPLPTKHRRSNRHERRPRGR